MELVSFLPVFAILQLMYLSSAKAQEASLNTTENRNTTSNSSSAEDSLDDRFNFNLGIAGAHGVGKYGGVSQSNALSYGINAGIRTPNGYYQNLYSNSGSKSNSFSSGFGAPLTFANTGSRARPGHAGGNAAAGIFGGRGSSYAQSHTQNIEIPLDNMGTVLLSNLKERNSTEANGTETASTTSQSVDDSLVFT